MVKQQHHLAKLLFALASAASLVGVLTQPAGAEASPTVALASPTSAANLKGGITLTASGAVASGSGDDIQNINFDYNGAQIVSESCAINYSYTQTSCTVSDTWNATGRSGSAIFTAVITTTNGLSTTSAPVTVNLSSPAPTISLSSPSAGSTVEGTVSFSATATIDPSQVDTINSIAFDANGASVDTQSCAINYSSYPTTCTATYNWNVTGKSGAEQLTAIVSTSNGVSATSAPVTVNVVSPPPTVSITSPVSGAALKAQMTIAVSAAVDPSQADTINAINVYDDGSAEIGTVSCSGQNICSGTVAWNTSEVQGRQVLTAKVDTEYSGATSAPVIVGGKHTAPKIALSPLPVEHVGESLPVSGTLRSGATPLPGISVTVRYNPAVGKTETFTTTTNSTGSFRATLSTRTNGTVTVTSAAKDVYAGARSKLRLGVLASVRCALAHTVVAINRVDTGNCTAAGVPSGTSVKLQYKSGAKWLTAFSVKVKSGGRFDFSLHSPVRRTFLVRVAISANLAYHLTSATVGRLTVR